MKAERFYLEVELADGSYRRRDDGGHPEDWMATKLAQTICAWWRVVDAAGNVVKQGPVR